MQLPDTTRVLSIREPWAYLCAAGWKCIENRTWNTEYRGWVLIHASKSDAGFSDPTIGEDLCNLSPRLADTLDDPRISSTSSLFLPGGNVIGAAFLGAVVRGDATTAVLPQDIAELLAQSVVASGIDPLTWFEGPFGFCLPSAVRFRQPIRVGGKLNLWRPSAELLSAARIACRDLLADPGEPAAPPATIDEILAGEPGKKRRVVAKPTAAASRLMGQSLPGR